MDGWTGFIQDHIWRHLFMHELWTHEIVWFFTWQFRKFFEEFFSHFDLIYL
jgi:hypothetical protein